MATDADGASLTYAIAASPTSGTVTVSGNIASYSPNAGFNGSDSFTYTANDGTDSSNTATVNISVIASSGFAGKIISTSGVLLPNIQIEALDASGAVISTVTSDASGEFEILGEAGTPLTLRFTGAGYANQVAVVSLPDLPAGMLPLNITMIGRSASQVVDVDVGGTISDIKGASVTVVAGSFVDTSGIAVSGNIDVTITPVNTEDITTFPSFPGEFLGIEEMTSQQTTIATLGTVEYTFSQGGEPLQLASGQTAQIEMPLWTSINPQNGNRIEAGDTIPLWSLNESTGIWEQENSGTVAFNLNSPTGLVLQATVSHFTWWNIDYPIPSAEVSVSLASTTTEGVGTVKVRTDAPGFSVSARNVLSGGDPVTGLIPANYKSCFWIEYVDLSGNHASTSEQCINSPVDGAQYSLNFAVVVTNTLTLNTPSYQSTYAESEAIQITVSPQTLESSVTYAVTSGTLPAGLTLTPDRNVYADLSGAIATPGSYQFTLTGTDAGGITDDVTIMFDVLSSAAPVLAPSQGAVFPAGNPVIFPITVISTGSSPVTSWSVVNADNSMVAPGITISSNGVFSMDNFSGGTQMFLVRAYNAAGPSNITMLTITDNFGQPL